jgi:hypothetical protein
MKALHINAVLKTVDSVEIEAGDNPSGIRDLLNCDTVDSQEITVGQKQFGLHRLYFDGDKNRYQRKNGFTFTSHLFMGDGVIVGRDPVSGEDVAARLSVFHVSCITKFLREDEAVWLRRVA